MPLAAASPEVALLLTEFGVLLFGLSVLGRLAQRYDLSPIPLYLLVGLAFGEGGFLPLDVSAEFTSTLAEIGVLLLLFVLGLEYSADELRSSLRSGAPAGLVDAVSNFAPGFLFGLVLGWGVTGAVVLGGVTYISSSGVIAKALEDLGRLGNRETPHVLSILVIEDLVMALYLPLLGILLLNLPAGEASLSLTVALVTVLVVLFVSLRYGESISRMVWAESEEIALLATLGLMLAVAGLAQQVEVSAAIGAFLVGIALSGRTAELARRLTVPLRDLFAAVFFVVFGLQIDPSLLPAALPAALLLAVVTAATKMGTGWYAARRAGIAIPGRVRAATALVARGEFSIVIAGLGAGVNNELGPLAAAYVLLLASVGPVLMRGAEPFGRILTRGGERQRRWRWWRRRRAEAETDTA